MARSTPLIPRSMFVAGALGIHAAVLSATTHVTTGDASVYASEIRDHLEAFSCQFLEAGHLFWRPLGYGLSLVFGVGEVGEGFPYPILDLLTHATVLFSFLAVGCLAAWIWSLAPSLGGAAAAMLLLILSKAFINYAQVGTSYVPGLAFLALGLLLLLEASRREEGHDTLAILAGVALTVSVGMWGPYLLALPAAILSAGLLEGFDRKTRKQALLASLGAAMAALVLVAWVAFELRLRGPADFLAWARSASHGIELIGGLPRAVLGFSRSFVHLGNLGEVVRGLLAGGHGDGLQLSPGIVGQTGLFLAFYAFISSCILLVARTPQGGRTLALLSLFFVPVAAFAVSWQGGDLERYLPAFPGAGLLVASAFSGHGRGPPHLLLGIFIAVVGTSNLSFMLSPRVEARHREAFQRIQRAISPPSSTILVVHSHRDEAWRAYRNHPHVLRDHPESKVTYLILPLTPEVERWRESFAFNVLLSWDRDQDVMLSNRLFAEAPEEEWGWREEEDSRVSWGDLRSFLTHYVDPPTEESGTEGFVLLPESPENRSRLEILAGSMPASLGDWIDRCPYPPRRAEGGPGPET